MIYFDNSATSLHKPPQVAQGAAFAIQHLGNPGRGIYQSATNAARAIYAARAEVARLCAVDDPLKVAFTSGATEGLNLLIKGLIGPDDHVITTVLEHNSVLRPLYQTGCSLSFIDCDDEGRLFLDELEALLQPATKAVVCTHGSNVVGTVTDIKALQSFAQSHGLFTILDAAQTMGCIPVGGQDADYICFTGHKALMGPQGTGGVVATGPVAEHIYKTGGTGADSFSPHQPAVMPDMLEAGTPNAQGLFLLQKAVAHINQTGLEALRQRENALVQRFLEDAHAIPGLRLYGPATAENRLPVLAFNLAGIGSEEVALQLWEGHGIATRPGSHCAPLLHRRFGTEHTGMVRLSFGAYNTHHEVETALAAIEAIARRGGR